MDVWCELGKDCKREVENNCVVNSNRINQQISCLTCAGEIKWLIKNVRGIGSMRFIIITKMVAEIERNNSNEWLKKILADNPNKKKKQIKRKSNYDHERRMRDKQIIRYIRSEVTAKNSNPVIIDLVDEKKVSVIGDKSQKIISTMQQKDKKVDKTLIWRRR